MVLVRASRRLDYAIGDPAQRVVRVLYGCLAIGGLIYLAFATDAMLKQNDLLAGHWSFAAFVLMGLACLGMLVAAPRGSLRLLPVLATVLAGVFSVTLIAWLPTLTVASTAGEQTLWPLSLISIATTAGALAWPGPVSWTFTVVACTGGALLRYFADESLLVLPAAQEGVYMLLMSSLFAALAQLARRVGRDEATQLAAARDAAAAAASERAVSAQRTRFAALVHDDVLATLMVGARATPELRESIRQYARQAIANIDELEVASRAATVRSAAISHADVAPDEAAARWRTAADLPHAPRLEVNIDPEAAPLPAPVVDAIGEALAESLRNWARHAAGSPCAASAEITPWGARAHVTDGGPGFITSRVPPERLGLRVSVIERMALVGGAAAITSAPASGTTVSLEWQRHQPESRRDGGAL